jgi:putative FmdB family regulatory protein
MPSYDYRCQGCGAELVIVHRMSESVSQQAHAAPGGAACSGPLERLISKVGLAKTVGQKPPSDSKLQGLGFTKYVRGDKGYEKAFGGADTPDFVKRE